MEKKRTALVKEFLRNGLVGILVFLVDATTIMTFRKFIFTHGTEKELAVCTASGFIAGVIVSYSLSVLFVFEQKEEKTKKRKVQDFIVFVIISITGLGLTELGMYAGVCIFGFHYMLTKFVVAVIVFLWNYVIKKFLIFG